MLEQWPRWSSIKEKTASRRDFSVNATQVTDGHDDFPDELLDSHANVHDIDALFEDNFDKLNALFETVVEDNADSFPCVERSVQSLPVEFKQNNKKLLYY